MLSSKMMKVKTSSFCSVQFRSLSSWSLCQLKTKSVLELQGGDTLDYLQGLVTNDLYRLSSSRDYQCLFTFMLNHLGRVVADLFVYKNGDNSFLIESDTRVVSAVYKQLLVHKLRRDVSVRKRDDLKVWTVHPGIEVNLPLTRIIEPYTVDGIVASNDPRVPSIPIYRFISSTTLDRQNAQKILNFKPVENVDQVCEMDESVYIEFRYKHGLSEGATDHLTGNSFPLESNGDYLNAISFLKGCYVGQELTARTHHTGVTRKRLMPMVLPQCANSLVQGIELLSADGKKRIGNIRGIQGSKGLGLLYMEVAMKHGWKMYPATEQGMQVIAYKPFWWPESS